MDNYDQLFLQQLAPFIKFHFPQSLVDSDVTKSLRRFLHQFDIANKIWDNSIIKNRLSSTKYIVEVVEGEEKVPLRESSGSNEHSAFSPFNQKSDIFPNGILTAQWFGKYISKLPFAYVSTFQLPSDLVEDATLAAQINALKQHCLKQNIKFVAIIVSSSADPNDDDERINKLRQLTSLPRLTGLLYLHDSPITLARDAEILISTLLSNLKNLALDYYSGIKYKIEQRHKKYYSCPSTQSIDTQIEISPKFLETRNLIKLAVIDQFISPHNLEPCLKVLEVAYQNLVDIVRDTFHNKLIDLPTISDHDLNLYFQFRTLLDILAFHIVRGYFSTEEPLSALKKHRAHIANVLSVSEDKFDVIDSNWVSIQYQWLAELMKLIPQSIVTSTHATVLKKKSKNNSNIIGFFGGVKFNEAYSFDVITNPGLVFLKASENIRCPSETPKSRFNYLYKYKDPKDVVQHKIELLNSSIASLTPSNQSTLGETFEPMLSYLNWLIAEEYFNLGDLEDAVSYYERSYKIISTSVQWPGIAGVILQKLAHCYASSKDAKNELFTILKLSTCTPLLTNIKPFPINEVLDSASEIDVEAQDSSTEFFNVDILMLNENFQEEAHLYDNCITQVVLKSKVDYTSLRKILPEDVDAKIVINKVEITYKRLDGKKGGAEFKNVLLSHNDEVEEPKSVISKVELQTSDKKSTLAGTGNLKASVYEGHFMKVIQFEQLSQASGPFQVVSAKIHSSMEISDGKKSITLKTIEDHTYEDRLQGSIAHHAVFYRLLNGRLTKQPVRLNGRVPHSLRFLPLKPDVNVTLDSSTIGGLILGEKVALPFSITFKHPKSQRVRYKKILLSPKITVLPDQNDQQFASRITTQASWDNLKDDEPLDLQSLVESKNEATEVHHLNVYVHCPPTSINSRISNSKSTILIDLKTLVTEESDKDDEEGEEVEDDVALYETAIHSLPLINFPFQCSYIISPRYRTDSIDMPSPFILSSSSEASGSSLPIASRLWLGSLSVVDLYQQLNTSHSKLEIVGAEFIIKSKNAELNVEQVGEVKHSEDGKINQLFTINSKNGLTHRNAPILTTVSINWKRENGTVNEFKSAEWEITLPLSDPRVLLTAEQSDKDKDAVKLTYILENPTPRIFTFTTTMGSEEEDKQWDFSDVRNIVPLKQPPFPVLPFGRHFMEFYASTSQVGDKVQLPSFKVYDVHYKIALPTLSVSDKIVVKDSKLYWSREEAEKVNLN
ncbi:Gryzun, putative trafficking through golgi-domain-containing protein [Scheffersomyces xylosifermentans]|uniref:Gryzun, putative trafficking through golgi-domain-containing protein n=1 Tax=Scheffersomyces xylosifermentans TaxID=1304137 RepID=UPI00315D122F